MMMFSLSEILTATGGKATKTAAEEFAAVTTDSRQITAGSLFVALKGEKFDGEDFLAAAADKGAAGALVSNTCPAEKYAALNLSVVTVPDTLKGYQALANAHRQKFTVPVIAVTGSNGKTTTKDLTAAALSSLGDILKTEANFNNEIGLPLTLLKLTSAHKAAVVEMGMRGLGQITALMRVACPNIGIVTNVGEVHAELLGSIDNIAKAKGEMAENMPKGGSLILNADDSRVFAMQNKAAQGVKIFTYGIDSAAFVRAVKISATHDKTTFTAECDGVPHEFTIPLLGRHNVYNALAAIAVALAVGVTPNAINEGFAKMQPTKMRFETFEKNGCTVINDAYNASPASMKAAIETVAETAGARKKIAVLGDMLELGDFAEQGHRDIGKLLAAKKFTAVITYGELAKLIADEAQKGGLTAIATDSHAEAAAAVKNYWQDNAVILFKGSRGMKMEKIIELV